MCLGDCSRVTGDHRLLVGRYDVDFDAAVRCADAGRVRRVGDGIEAQAEPSQALAHGSADFWGVFANAGREDQSIQSTQRAD